MIIFNNGKYKSILAAEKGELAEIAETVQKDKDFRPHFHNCPLTGLMNDPNGLSFDGEKYHLFYQWFPFDAIHGMKHWKHLITKISNIINWQMISFLANFLNLMDAILVAL